MPMTAPQLERHAERWNLGAAAYELINQTRESAPARYVESGECRNTPWRYPSKKLGLTVALESSEEHGYAVQREFDPTVLEYWDQPPRVVLLTPDSAGRIRRVPYTPDFLVLYEDKAQIVQVKTSEQCHKLLKQQPARWVMEGGKACDRAAQAYYAKIGLDHVVHVSGPGEKIRVENYALLLRARSDDVPLDEVKRVIRAIGRLPVDAVISLQQLLDEAGIESASAALRLLQDEMLFTDMDRCRISVPAQCLVATSASHIAEYFAATDAAATDGLDYNLMHSPEIIAAYQRRQELEGLVAPTHAGRTHRDWRQALAGANGRWTSLAPRHALKGNRNPRLTSVEAELLQSTIGKYYLTPECLTVSAAHGQYELDHEALQKAGQLPADSRPVHLTTFRRHCRAVSAEVRAKARSGRRAGNAHATPVAHEHRHLTPTRVFERAHIDHYLCDIYVLVGQTDKPETRRPWLTAMRDEATGAILAMSLSFHSPSQLSCLHVIRDCVRRHGRMPETIVVDNGAEFNSIYFETVLACLGVAKQSRPPANPRTGGIIEGLFHSVKAFLATQHGNTTNDARARSASGSHKGKKRARWTLEALFTALDEFMFQCFNQATSAESLSTRTDLVSRSLAMFPNSGKQIAFDERFLAQTAAPLKRKLKVDPARGVRHLERWFSHPKLFCELQDAERVEAFVEPWDQNRIYVRFHGELLTCRHGSHGNSNLTVDFSEALRSILFLECQDVRAEQAKVRLRKVAKLARAWHTKPDRQLEPAGTPAAHEQAIVWPKADQVLPYGRRKPS